jgi:LysM repeat protein
MSPKIMLQSVVAVAVLVASLATASGVSAGSGCGSAVTVQMGDTLTGIAMACGITVDALRAANPGVGWWPQVGQVLYMPTGGTSGNLYYAAQLGGSTYVVQSGDTLGELAFRYGVSLGAILAVNPQICNPSLIYPGQVINLPASVHAQPCTCYAPTYYAPANYPTSNYPPSYYPPTYQSPTPLPPQVDYSQFRGLKVSYSHGLLVRTGPGRNFPEIVSPLVSAVQDTVWLYRKTSVTVDSTGFVWAEVALPQMVNGYSTGWILVKDELGKYFTIPNIDH